MNVIGYLVIHLSIIINYCRYTFLHRFINYGLNFPLSHPAMHTTSISLKAITAYTRIFTLAIQDSDINIHSWKLPQRKYTQQGATRGHNLHYSCCKESRKMCDAFCIGCVSPSVCVSPIFCLPCFEPTR